MRADSCVAVAGVKKQKQKKKQAEFQGLQKQQMFASEEVPIKVFTGFLSCTINTSDVPEQWLSHQGLCWVSDSLGHLTLTYINQGNFSVSLFIET